MCRTRSLGLWSMPRSPPALRDSAPSPISVPCPRSCVRSGDRPQRWWPCRVDPCTTRETVMANASNKKMGGGANPGPNGHQFVGQENPDEAFDEDDIASEIKGRNSLQGNDQGRVHDERLTQAASTRKTEG